VGGVAVLTARNSIGTLLLSVVVAWAGPLLAHSKAFSITLQFAGALSAVAGFDAMRIATHATP